MNHATLTIDNKIMPCPSTLVWSISDFDLDSGRSAITGEMVRERVCSKEKIQLTWNSADLSTSEISTILSAVSPVFIQVEYFSPLVGDYVQKTMYCSDRELNFYRVINGVPQIDNISFSLVEK